MTVKHGFAICFFLMLLPQKLLPSTIGSQHFLQHIHGIHDVLLKLFMVSQEVLPSLRNQSIQFGAHVVHIRLNRTLNIIPLPIQRGVYINPLFLMKKTVCRFDTILRHHAVRSVVITSRPHLLLFLTIHISMLQQLCLHLLRFTVKTMAQLLQRIKFAISQQHVDARHQHERIFR